MTLGTLKKSKSEDQVIAQCKKYLFKAGWNPVTLFTGGIPLGGGRYATNPAKGIPDSLVFHLETGRMVWIEYKKTVGGRITPEQKTWHTWLEKCGQTIWVVNSLETLKEKLQEV